MVKLINMSNWWYVVDEDGSIITTNWTLDRFEPAMRKFIALRYTTEVTVTAACLSRTGRSPLMSLVVGYVATDVAILREWHPRTASPFNVLPLGNLTCSLKWLLRRWLFSYDISSLFRFDGGYQWKDTTLNHELFLIHLRLYFATGVQFPMYCSLLSTPTAGLVSFFCIHFRLQFRMSTYWCMHKRW